MIPAQSAARFAATLDSVGIDTNKRSGKPMIGVSPVAVEASRGRGKFTPVMQAKVEAYLRDDLSPEQVTGVMRRKGGRNGEP